MSYEPNERMNRISEAAYHRWLQNPDSDSHTNWLEAEREVDGADGTDESEQATRHQGTDSGAGIGPARGEVKDQGERPIEEPPGKD